MTHKVELTAVWPLRKGLTGIHHITFEPVPLYPHNRGWMDYPDAVKSRDAGDVQIMIEESPQSLKYTTKVVSPAVDLEPEIPSTAAPKTKPRLSRRKSAVTD